MAASVQGRKARAPGGSQDEPELEEKTGKTMDNPLHDVSRMNEAVAHANMTAMTYGVDILSINILSAVPIDVELTKALACGAVASAQALHAETAARSNAKATKLDATATADKAKIEAEGQALAEVIRAKATAESARLVAEGSKDAANILSTASVAVNLARVDKSSQLIGKNDKFFFGQEPSYLSSLVLKGDRASRGAKRGVFSCVAGQRHVSSHGCISLDPFRPSHAEDVVQTQQQSTRTLTGGFLCCPPIVQPVAPSMGLRSFKVHC
ncbi:unnamed protein product [Prorocentrum cordatum]|uniref:Prohibitin n=1 Tax=Prorocentrum cordatum TaxID=2364126 RepID=A0ABN9U714_9DINO|nr:unnamed protein product [Polarella glacialis]